MDTYRGRVVLLGDSSVGKTSIILQFTEGHGSKSTAGQVLDKKVKTVEIGPDKVQLHIWDTAGQERYDSLSLSYCRNASIVLIVYDVTCFQSYQNVNAWADRVGIDSNDMDVVVVGNKSDLKANREVTAEMGKAKAREFLSSGEVEYFETSVKKNDSIETLFNHVASVVLLKKQARRAPPSSEPVSFTRNSSRHLLPCCR